MKRILLLLFTCLMLLSWPQRAMAELQTAVFAGGCFWCLEHDLDFMEQLGMTTGSYAAQICESVATHCRAAVQG